MKITLQKANILLNKFNNERENLRELLRDNDNNNRLKAITTVEVTLANLTPKVADKIQVMINFYRQQLKYYLEIEADFFKLKEAIFSLNQITGISKKLSQIEFLSLKIALYDDLIIEKKQNNKLTLTITDINYHLLQDNLSHQDGMGKLYIEVFDINLLYSERQEAINRLNKMEDEIAHLNNQTIIDIDFSAPSRHLLGLE